MFSPAAVLNYFIGAIVTIVLAYVLRFIDKNPSARLILFICGFYTALPIIMLRKFLRGDGRLGRKRKSMTLSDQAVAVFLILLLTYWIAFQVAKEAKEEDKKLIANIDKVKEPSLYKTVWEPPIERRLAQVVPNHGVA